MSQEPLVPEEVIARQPPEAQAIIRVLLARIAEQERRVAVLEAEIASVRAEIEAKKNARRKMASRGKS